MKLESRIMIKYPRFVIMGDLNVDLLKTTVSSRELVYRFGSFSLSVVNDSAELTHFQSDSIFLQRMQPRVLTFSRKLIVLRVIPTII
jgi:hypothetical protein